MIDVNAVPDHSMLRVLAVFLVTVPATWGILGIVDRYEVIIRRRKR